MDEEQKNEGLSVEFGQEFINRFENYPPKDIEKIKGFVQHVSEKGLNDLPGRNKSSDNVDTNDHDFIKKVSHAKKHNLWHYHIGIPQYDKTNKFGDWTSEWVIHYQRLGNEIHIVELDDHPPFTLPAEKYLK